MNSCDHSDFGLDERRPETPRPPLEFSGSTHILIYGNGAQGSIELFEQDDEASQPDGTSSHVARKGTGSCMSFTHRLNRKRFLTPIVAFIVIVFATVGAVIGVRVGKQGSNAPSSSRPSATPKPTSSIHQNSGLASVDWIDGEGNQHFYVFF